MSTRMSVRVMAKPSARVHDVPALLFLTRLDESFPIAPEGLLHVVYAHVYTHVYAHVCTHVNAHR